jgi:hypothetical protein
VDVLLASVRQNATEGGWDPILLPSDSDEFDVTVEYIFSLMLKIIFSIFFFSYLEILR